MTKDAERKEADTRECVVAVKTECSHALDPRKKEERKHGRNWKALKQGNRPCKYCQRLIPICLKVVRELSVIESTEKRPSSRLLESTWPDSVRICTPLSALAEQQSITCATACHADSVLELVSTQSGAPMKERTLTGCKNP